MKTYALALVLVIAGCVPAVAATTADHTCIAEFDLIPESTLTDIASNWRIYYGHTSHGGQIMTGIELLENESAAYTPPIIHERSDDLGHNGDTSWVADLRSWLNANGDYNMAMMSWCGGASDNDSAGISVYLNKMNQLEADYPAVTFVYMTGHLDGTGVAGNLYRCNNYIRSYCSTHNKVLFDFADIESYDPDGNYYPDETDACNWCSAWCATRDCCGASCAHSHCFNCYIKGKGWWWLMANLGGWSASLNTSDDDPEPLPQSFRLAQNYPNPFNPRTAISFELEAGGPTRLEIVNLLGQTVAILLDQYLSAGSHQVEVGAEAWSSGVYFYRLTVGETRQTRKMLLLK